MQLQNPNSPAYIVRLDDSYQVDEVGFGRIFIQAKRDTCLLLGATSGTQLTCGLGPGTIATPPSPQTLLSDRK